MLLWTGKDGHVKWLKGSSPSQSPVIYNEKAKPGSPTSGNNPTFGQ